MIPYNPYTYNDLQQLKRNTPLVKSKIKNGKFVFDETTNGLAFVFLGNEERTEGQTLTELIEIVFETPQPNLRYLDASNCQIESIVIKNCPKLQTLYLSGNWLQSIIFEQDCPELQLLDLSYNQLMVLELPFGLTNLKCLYLYKNKLVDLSGLAGFFIRAGFDFNIGENPAEIAGKTKTKIISNFKKILEQGVDYLFEAKLIIVGEAGAGKTTLLRKLEKTEAELPKPEETTWGIDVSELHMQLEKSRIPNICQNEKLPDRIDFRLNAWDFAGQEIYHATHRFFLTRRSVYALVSDERKEDTDFKYWLQMVEKFGNESPLLIVQNQKEDRTRDIQLPTLQVSFPNLKEALPVNFARIDSRFFSLKNAIEYWVCHLPQIGSPVPAKWKVVRQKLELLSDNFISQNEYFDICSDKGIKTRKDQLELSGYFHEIGVFLHFQEDKMLRDTIFLKTSWITKAVYLVVESKLAKEEKFGRLTADDFDAIWSNCSYCDKHMHLIQMMKHFLLIYETESHNEYVIPQLLKNDKPVYTWNNLDNRKVKYDYPKFMPKGILWQTIVKLSRLISDNLIWQRGVIFEREKTLAEVTENFELGYIEIRVEGFQKQALLTRICDAIDEINNIYQKLEFDKLIPCNCEICSLSEKPHLFKYSILRRRLENRKLTIDCEISYFEVDINGLLNDFFIHTTNSGRRQPTDNGTQTDVFPTRNKVFISYSHQDSEYQVKVQKHLNVLENEGLEIHVWDDTKIKPGMKWQEEIEKNLKETKVAILLVSTDFLISDFITKKEVPAFLKAAENDGAVIIPLIVKPCRFLKHKALSQFQAVHNPVEPLSDYSDTEQDKILIRLADRVEELLSE